MNSTLKTLLMMAMIAPLAACGDEGAGGSAQVDPNNAPNNAPNNTPEPEGEPEDPGACEQLEVPESPRALAVIYTDKNATDVSTYLSGFEGGRDELLAQVPVSLFAADGEREASTCADGRAAFGPLEDGVYLLSPQMPPGHCGTKNCARRLPEAIREGKVKIVTFGDSIPVVGDEPFFPERLAQLLSPLAEVEDKNVAIGGTTSESWLPGAGTFERRLAPELADADVVMISLGGNDVLGFVQANVANLGNIDALVEDVYIVVEQIVENLLTIADAIRAINPDADLVYCLYPDYSLAVNNQMWSLVNQFVGADIVHDVLVTARDSLPLEEDIILVDVFDASQGLPLDDYLFDSLHFNDLGQNFYAQEIFKALGGVLVGPSPIDGDTPLGLDQQFSVSP